MEGVVRRLPGSVRDSILADKLRRGLAWTLYALTLGLCFEGAARLAFSSPGFLGRVSANDDPSWRLRWVAGHGAARSLAYSIDDWHPTRGWALKPGLRDVPVVVVTAAHLSAADLAVLSASAVVLDKSRFSAVLLPHVVADAARLVGRRS